MQEADWHMKLWGGGLSPFLDSSAPHTPESLLEKMIATPCCLQNNEDNTNENKRETGTALFPKYLHTFVDQLLRDICGGPRTSLLWNFRLVSFLF